MILVLIERIISCCRLIGAFLGLLAYNCNMDAKSRRGYMENKVVFTLELC